MKTRMTITFATDDPSLVELLKAVLEVFRRRDGVMMRVREVQEDTAPPQVMEGMPEGANDGMDSV